MEILLFLLMLTVLIFFSLAIYNISYSNGYKQGQIDALKGVNKYVLVEFKDGTREYYKQSELKDLIEYTLV